MEIIVFFTKLKATLYFAVVLTCFGLAPTAANADNKNYCVYAKVGIGFVLSAKWLDANMELVRSENIAVFDWACAPNSAKHLSLGVFGGATGGKAIRAILTGASGIGAAVACGASAGAACAPAVAAAGAASVALISKIPDGEETFLFHTYSKPEYIEVTGTMWSPNVNLTGEKCDGC